MMKYGAAPVWVDAEGFGGRILKPPRPTKADDVYSELPPPFDTKIDAAVCVNPANRHFVLFSGGQVMQFCSWSYKPAGERVIELPCSTMRI